LTRKRAPAWSSSAGPRAETSGTVVSDFLFAFSGFAWGGLSFERGRALTGERADAAVLFVHLGVHGMRRTLRNEWHHHTLCGFGNPQQIGDACRRLLAGDGDAEIALARFTVAHRIRAMAAFRGARLVAAAMHRRLAKRLQMRNLTVRVAGPTGVVAKSAVGRLRAFARFA